MKKEIGLYIHIPFCARKCVYCDFASYAGQEALMPAYVDRVLEEAREKSGLDCAVATLYIGGGTPSLLPSPLMEKLLEGIRGLFSFSPQAECSCECNPGTVTDAFLFTLRREGVNRLSFGAQAYQPRLLSLLGRIHTWDQVKGSVEAARRAGFENINLDLMLGLPTQTLSDVRETLSAALSLRPTHLSCYGLIVEEGTPLQEKIRSGAWHLPEEELERDMYECCRETLAAHGFRQYEISNFALPGFACRHNTDCWQRKEYVGLGCAACGFSGNERYQNPRDLGEYLSGVGPEITLLTPEDARFESVMLGLRMMEGVSEADFYRMHSISLRDAFGKKLRKPLAEGLVEWREGRLRLTRKGMDVQNAVLVVLL